MLAVQVSVRLGCFGGFSWKPLSLRGRWKGLTILGMVNKAVYPVLKHRECQKISKPSGKYPDLNSGLYLTVLPLCLIRFDVLVMVLDGFGFGHKFNVLFWPYQCLGGGKPEISIPRSQPFTLFTSVWALLSHTKWSSGFLLKKHGKIKWTNLFEISFETYPQWKLFWGRLRRGRGKRPLMKKKPCFVWTNH